jgi:hypothetical protein
MGASACTLHPSARTPRVGPHPAGGRTRRRDRRGVQVGSSAGSSDTRQGAAERMSRPDFPAWLDHVRSATGYTHPVRLVGGLDTAPGAPATPQPRSCPAGTPTGSRTRAIDKACRSRLEAVCPFCSKRCKRDAYNSSAPASSAATMCPVKWPPTRRCSPPPPHPRPALCTPATAKRPPASAAAPCDSTDPDVPFATEQDALATGRGSRRSLAQTRGGSARTLPKALRTHRGSA